MKNAILILLAVCTLGVSSQAQTKTAPEITKKNSWLKLGINLGVPVGDNISRVSSFVAGLELKFQLMESQHVGLGLTTGYNHFFAKDNFEDFGNIPLGGFIRVYPARSGFFAGLDVGYSLITGIENANGGLYLKPQVGYHNYDWNIFGFYNHVFRSDTDGSSIGHVGIGATYNIRFK